MAHACIRQLSMRVRPSLKARIDKWACHFCLRGQKSAETEDMVKIQIHRPVYKSKYFKIQINNNLQLCCFCFFTFFYLSITKDYVCFFVVTLTPVDIVVFVTLA